MTHFLLQMLVLLIGLILFTVGMAGVYCMYTMDKWMPKVDAWMDKQCGRIIDFIRKF